MDIYFLIDCILFGVLTEQIYFYVLTSKCVTEFQVAEPLRAMVMGAPLEDARHLAQRYDRIRQEADAQVKILAHI